MTQREVAALRKEWYGRLEDEGFKDIERVMDDGTSFLRDNFDKVRFGQRHNKDSYAEQQLVNDQNGQSDPNDHTNVEIAFTLLDANRHYYVRCSQFRFSKPARRWTPLQRAVWDLHCEGHTVRHIARHLGHWDRVVQRIINTLRQRMEQWWLATAPLREAERQLRAIGTGLESDGT